MGSNPTPGKVKFEVQIPHLAPRPEKVSGIVAQLAQLVERRTFNPVAVGSSPTLGNGLVAQLVRASVL